MCYMSVLNKRVKQAHAELARVAALHRGLERGHEGLIGDEPHLHHVTGAKLRSRDGELAGPARPSRSTESVAST